MEAAKYLLRINVRTLAEFYTEGGDLVRTANMIERMHEGTRTHQARQAEYDASWRREVSLSMDLDTPHFILRLFGRADGICLTSQPPVIEEIKSTERDLLFIGENDIPAHWAQAELYGAMLCESEELDSVNLRLTYRQLSGGHVSFERIFSRDELLSKAKMYAEPYVKWASALMDSQLRSRQSMRSLPFPFDEYRAGQREMAVNVYIALKNSRRLLCQAPTGIGKTAASVYPALKALGEDHISRIFYLSARGTGQRAAEGALERMRQRGLWARHVTLSAREKMCVQPEGGCSPEECPRANGYYDRRRAALYEALDMQRFSADDIRALAEKHTLCPFELSLDLSELADMVICDYNYLFDPRVRLQRFFLGKSDAGILIDEAHNLCSRARDMLSSEISEKSLRTLRTNIGKASGRKHPLYLALTQLFTAFKPLHLDGGESLIQQDKPTELIEAIREASAHLSGHLESPQPWRGELTERFFELLAFIRCADGYDGRYRTLYEAEGKNSCRVKLWCVDPSSHISGTLDRVHGAALFSATLAPMPFYRDVLGLSEEKGDALLSLPSPFPKENLLVLRASLPVRYSQREQSMDALCALLKSFLEAHFGNYMIFFPSYAYMQQVTEKLSAILSEDVELIVQQREMDDAARTQFLERFKPHNTGTLCGAAVLGGVFAEGIDLPDDRLRGAVIVGTGVPMICTENDVLREAYGQHFSQGYRYAYLYPGLARVLQAAGRVIRSHTDKGAVLLIDSRWSDREHQPLLPEHWQVRSVRTSEDLTAQLRAFYRGFLTK